MEILINESISLFQREIDGPFFFFDAAEGPDVVRIREFDFDTKKHIIVRFSDEKQPTRIIRLKKIRVSA